MSDVVHKIDHPLRGAYTFTRCGLLAASRPALHSLWIGFLASRRTRSWSKTTCKRCLRTRK